MYKRQLLDLAVTHEIVAKSGTWFSYKEERIGQGRENSKNFLLDHPDMMQDIENQLREKLELPLPRKAPAPPAEKSGKDKKKSAS